MKRIIIIITSIVIIFFLLDILDIFQIRFANAKWEKTKDVVIINNSVDSTLKYFLTENDYKNLDSCVIFYNTWSPHCGPCVKEIPYLNRIAMKYANQKIKFISYCFDENITDQKKILEERELTFNYLPITSKPGLRMTIKKLAKITNNKFEIDTTLDEIPNTCIISKNRTISYFSSYSINPADSNKLYSLIDSLLLEK